MVAIFVLYPADRQYVRQAELVFGKQVVEFAFELEFSFEARVDPYEGQLGLLGGEQVLECAEFDKS